MLSQPRPRKPKPTENSDLSPRGGVDTLRTASFAAARTFVGKRLRRFTADPTTKEGGARGRGGGVAKSLSHGASTLEGE